MPELTAEMNEILDEQDAEKAKRRELATRVMLFARDQIMVSLRFLDRALFRMPLVPSDVVESYGVDGREIRFGVNHVLESFSREKNRCTRAFLHMIFHCIFSHPFQCENLDGECWNLACDIAVEASILDLDLADTRLIADEEMRRLLKHLKREVPALTAEKIYRFLLDDPSSAARYFAQEELFRQDDHRYWIPPRVTDAAQRTGDTITADTMTAMVGCHEADTGEEGADQLEDIDEALLGQTRDEWADVSQHAKTDLETFSREQGFGAGSLLWNLKETLREKYDYGEFLKKFAVLGEEMHINDDEFDYIYYTYGLKLYENMPLVEPLEYRENKRIREFVIAIDTSGSCQGATVERFLQKTYEILKNTESYFSRVNIHIIQCDSKIQRDVKVTTDDEFDAYMQDVQLSGFGGTDFRPVFDYVDELIERHEFQNLRGLIYFTDGRGTFPEQPPDYETAFVFVEEGFEIPEVPPWAIKLVLREEEI
ncbi:MAG: VWA-like domain-containing protein [Lachnospiraceae bacterium]|nr:VWA-like domain-containing protein [Lachnospiraceae bacterium]